MKWFKFSMGILQRKTREKTIRRQQIMVAGRRIFSNKGFGKATMEDIAKEAELSPGTLYLYFKGKNELYTALSLRTIQYLNIRLEKAITSQKESKSDQKMSILKEALYDVYRFDPLVLTNIFRSQSGGTWKNISPQLFSQIQELYHSALGKIAKILEEGISQGNFIAASSKSIANVIWAVFLGIVFWEDSKRIIYHDHDHFIQTMDNAFDIFDRGLRKCN